MRLVMGLAVASVAGAAEALADSLPAASSPATPSSPPAFGHIGGNLAGALVDYQVGDREVTSWTLGADVDMLVERVSRSHWGFFGRWSAEGYGGRGGGQFVLLLAAGLDLTVQYEAPVASSHGPILALGVEAQTFQFHPYGWSWFEGPRPEIGYRWQQDGILIRGGLFGGLLAGAGTFDTAHGSIATPDLGARLGWRRTSYSGSTGQRDSSSSRPPEAPDCDACSLARAHHAGEARYCRQADVADGRRERTVHAAAREDGINRSFNEG
jgi:hypothetical protein